MMALIKEAEKRIRDQGGRMTAQRKLIIKALDDLGSHPTADEL